MTTTDQSIRTVFPRNKSGLVREFGLIDVLIFNILGYSLGVALTTNPVFVGGFAPAASIYVVLTLGMLVAFSNGMTYGLFAGTIPRSGGDYVFIGRTLSPGLGFVANWGFTFSQVYGLALLADWTITQALSPALTTFGATTSRPLFVHWGEFVGHPQVVFTLATVVLAMVFVVTLSGTRTVKWFLNSLFFLAVAGVLVLGYAFFSVDHMTFVVKFNEFMAHSTGVSNAYSQIIDLARARGLRPQDAVSGWEIARDSGRALPLGFLIFLGFTYSVYVGSDVKEPQKSQSRGILISLALGYVVFMAIMGRYFYIVGHDFNSAIGIPEVVEKSGLPAGNSMLFFGGLLVNNVILNCLMNVGIFLWFFLLPFVIVQVCVRNLFAWAFDRLMPEKLTDLSTNNGVPWRAVLVVLIAAELFLAVMHIWGITLVGPVAVASICFLLTSIAAVVLPSRRPAIFANAPPLARKSFLGFPMISAMGFISIPFFLWILYSSLKYPQVSGTDDVQAVVMVLVIYGLGSLIYFFRRRWLNTQLKRSGLDLATLWEQIPPE
jgi:amino acid transporter